jgi:hypothetical protein
MIVEDRKLNIIIIESLPEAAAQVEQRSLSLVDSLHEKLIYYFR